MGMSKILEKAKEIQERTNRELSSMLVHADVGDGKVTAKMNGHRHLLALKVAPEMVDPGKIAELEAMILEAVNEVTDEMTQNLVDRFGETATHLPSLLGP